MEDDLLEKCYKTIEGSVKKERQHFAFQSSYSLFRDPSDRYANHPVERADNQESDVVDAAQRCSDILEKLIQSLRLYPGREGNSYLSIWHRDQDSVKNLITKIGNWQTTLNSGFKTDTDLLALKFEMVCELFGTLKHSDGILTDEWSRCTLIRPHLARLIGMSEQEINNYVVFNREGYVSHGHSWGAYNGFWLPGRGYADHRISEKLKHWEKQLQRQRGHAAVKELDTTPGETLSDGFFVQPVM